MEMLRNYGRNLLNIFCFLLWCCVLAFVAPRLLVFFMPFVLGWIISVIANPLVKFLDKRLKIMRKHSSMLIIILVIGLIGAGGYFAVVKIIQEVRGFLGTAPDMYQYLIEDLDQIRLNLQGLSSRLPPEVSEAVADVTENFTRYLGDLVGAVGAPTVAAAGNVAKNIPTALIHTIFTFLSAYFFIAQRERILSVCRAHIPEGIYEKWNFVINRFKAAVGGYFKAQFKIMGVVALILLAGFFVLGINYAIVLALLIAFLDMLPFFGTGTALIPWALFKVLSSDYSMAAGLIVIYLISQLVRQVIQPKIVGDSLGLDPLLTLVFMYIGYKVSSVFGMILAVPIGMILVQLYQAGAFDDVLQDVRELAEGLREMRKRQDG